MARQGEAQRERLLQEVADAFGQSAERMAQLLSSGQTPTAPEHHQTDIPDSGFVSWLATAMTTGIVRNGWNPWLGAAVSAILVPPFASSASAFVRRAELLSPGQRGAVGRLIDYCLGLLPPGPDAGYHELALHHACYEFWSDPSDERLRQFAPPESDAAIRSAIASSFASMGPPGTDGLVSVFPDDTDQLRHDCSGIAWSTLTQEWDAHGLGSRLWRHWDALPCMGPRALACLLPAFMWAALDEPHSELAEQVIVSLTPPPDPDGAVRFETMANTLTEPQREVVRRFLQYLRAEHYPPYPDYAAGILSEEEIADQCVVAKALAAYWSCPNTVCAERPVGTRNGSRPGSAQ